MKRLLVAMLVSCGGGKPPTRVAMTVSAKLPAGAEVAVVELGDVTYAFDRQLVSIVRGGKLVAHVDAPTRDGRVTMWQAATTIASPDGQGRWIVGIAGDTLWRINAIGELEAVAERLGIANANAKVLAIDSSGLTSVIGLAGGAIVSNTGSHVMRFFGFDASVVAAARDRVAIASPKSIAVFDLANSSKVSYSIENASYLGFIDATTEHPTLVAVVGGTVYQEDHGKLIKARAPATRRVAVAGSRLWFLGDAGLFAEDRDRAIVAMKSAPPDVTRVFGSRTGGVWVSRGADHAVRYTVDIPHEDPAWHKVVEPVFQRACAGCHLPGGTADLDLSTPVAWSFRRPEIIQRVLVTRTMPPADTELTDADRQALETWLRTAP